jgi:hypothetical protein
MNARYHDPELGMFIQPNWFPVTDQGVGTNRYACHPKRSGLRLDDNSVAG